MLRRYFQSWIFFALLSVGLLFLIPRDPKNAIFLGFSATRLALVGGFLVILSVAVAAAIWLRAHPARDAAWSKKLNIFGQQPVLQSGLAFFFAGWILAMILLLAYFFLTTDAYHKQLLLRLAPFMLFSALVAWSSLGLEPLRARRRQWAGAILLAIILVAAGRLLQGQLRSLIERPVPMPIAVRQTGQVITAITVFLYAAQFASAPRREWGTHATFLLLVAGLFALQWDAYPEKYWPSRPYLALYSPALITGLAWLGLLLSGAWHRGAWLRWPVEKRQKAGPWLYGSLVAALLLLTIPYLQSTYTHARLLNNSPRYTDQEEYLVFAKNARLNNFSYTGDHNRMPFYPFLQGLFYEPGMSDAEFFREGKQRNIWLSLALLVALAAIFHAHLNKFNAITLSGMVAFSLYIFKAPYFQAEILYYFLAFLSFILALDLLRAPSLWPAVALGIAAGLAHLTKASILPGLLLFLMVYFGREFFTLLAARRSGQRQLRLSLPRLGYGLLVAILFGTVIFPYARAVHERFGSYFYNVNLTFYIWYDDFIAAKAAEAEHHFAERYPIHLAAEELPGPAKYFREHTLGEVWERLQFGIQSQLHNLRTPFSVTNFHLSYLLVAGVAALVGWRHTWELVRRQPYPVIYALLYFGGYLAAFIWYSPVSPERRFTYGIYLPLTFATFSALQALAADGTLPARPDGIRIEPRRIISSAQIVLFLALALNVWLVLSERMYFDRYGA